MTARIARTGPLSTLVRPGRRAAAAAVLVAGGALALSGCGSGQISQTATQVASVNGNFANVGDISLRNVHVAYPNSDEYTNSKGGTAALAFVAINNSPATPDRLTKLSTDAGKVTIIPEGATDIAPKHALIAEATGTTVTDEERTTEGNTAIRVEISDLEKNLTPGLTIPVTFDFEQSGAVTVQVPVDAGPYTPRQASDKSSANEHHETGGGEEENAQGGGH
ncbi:hypothetical protein OG921_08755 [Aldersonia sp. NBC_00410]|uniref:hypothetical protein n=1 Tax=Aldersonia sp. NBC_00410 TaxID=2975954 RepID=UPI00224E8524|nr:hypothetical protein [Aldersonia sp. NBC_00410]MCX5043257.1 hypothetical protein [Aldersonia sp. NBC_00410]